MHRRLVLAIVVAYLCALGSPRAEAQTWKPRKKAKASKSDTPEKAKKAKKAKRGKKKGKRASSKPKRQRGRAKPAPPEPETDVIEEEDDDWPDNWDDDESDESDDESIDGEDDRDAGGEPADEGDSFVMGDNDLDVGPDATIKESDLRSDAAGDSRRLETRAMMYTRTGVDLVHDPVADAVGGITPFGEEVITFRYHGRAEGITRFGPRFKVKVSGRFDADLGLDANTNTNVQRYEAHVWETYADLYLTGLDVRFGNQLIVWGTADLLMPNDVINPRDTRRGSLERPDELRIPSVALQVRAYDGPFSLAGVWVPVAPVNRFDLFDTDYALLGPNAATSLERRVGAIASSLADDPMLGLAFGGIRDIQQAPDRGLDSGELGAELSLNFRRFDLHGYAFWGHERTPKLDVADELQAFLASTPVSELSPELLAGTVNELAMMGIAAVTTEYPRRVHVGGAFATRLEPVGLKVDVGFKPKATTLVIAPGSGPLLARSTDLDQVSATVSFDYDRGSEMTFVLEANHTRVLAVPEGREVFQMNGDRLTLLGSQFEWSPSDGPVTFKLLGFVSPESEPSYAVRPSVSLSGHDNLSVEVGASFYGGAAGSFGGLGDRNDEVQITVQYGL